MNIDVELCPVRLHLFSQNLGLPESLCDRTFNQLLQLHTQTPCCAHHSALFLLVPPEPTPTQLTVWCLLGEAVGEGIRLVKQDVQPVLPGPAVINSISPCPTFSLYSFNFCFSFDSVLLLLTH